MYHRGDPSRLRSVAQLIQNTGKLFGNTAPKKTESLYVLNMVLIFQIDGRYLPGLGFLTVV